MFRNSKLLFWTCEILLLTVIFYIWKSMGTLISPFVSVLNTILLPFLIAGFLYYITNPIVELLEKHLNQACVWHFDHPSTLVWDHWLRDLLSAPHLDQSVNQLDQFDSRALLGSPKFGSKTLNQSFVPECKYPVDDSAVKSLLYGYPTKSLE